MHYTPEQITDAMLSLGFDTDQICNLLATLERGRPADIRANAKTP